MVAADASRSTNGSHANMVICDNALVGPVGSGRPFTTLAELANYISRMPTKMRRRGKFSSAEDAALLEYICRNLAQDNLDSVGLSTAMAVAIREASAVESILAPRGYHALWIRTEAIARMQFNELPPETRTALKERLSYSSMDHETQWRAHASEFPEGYLRSFLAFKALNNLLGLQPRHDRKGPSHLKSRNSCPRGRTRHRSASTSNGNADSDCHSDASPSGDAPKGRKRRAGAGSRARNASRGNSRQNRRQRGAESSSDFTSDGTAGAACGEDDSAMTQSRPSTRTRSAVSASHTARKALAAAEALAGEVTSPQKPPPPFSVAAAPGGPTPRRLALDIADSGDENASAGQALPNGAHPGNMLVPWGATKRRAALRAPSNQLEAMARTFSSSSCEARPPGQCFNAPPLRARVGATNSARHEVPLKPIQRGSARDGDEDGVELLLYMADFAAKQECRDIAPRASPRAATSHPASRVCFAAPAHPSWSAPHLVSGAPQSGGPTHARPCALGPPSFAPPGWPPSAAVTPEPAAARRQHEQPRPCFAALKPPTPCALLKTAPTAQNQDVRSPPLSDSSGRSSSFALWPADLESPPPSALRLPAARISPGGRADDLVSPVLNIAPLRLPSPTRPRSTGRPALQRELLSALARHLAQRDRAGVLQSSAAH